MRIICRSATLQELFECFDLLDVKRIHSPKVAQQVPRIWEQYFQQGSLITTLFIDQDQQRIIGLSMEVFISDSFLVEIQQCPRHEWRDEVIRREIEGHSVVLTLAEAQQANRTTGLNLFFLSDPLPIDEVPVEQFQAVDVRWGEVLYDYRACNLRTIVWECYSQQSLQMGLSCGMRLYPDSETNIPTTGSRSSLLIINRDEAMSQYGTHVSQMFIHAPARFSFTTGQQELLRRALMGETDEELASSLYLSLSAIKKRWFSIYDRVQLVDAGILPENGDLIRLTRGTEKRRHLLHYLRVHPEELHPINAAGIA